VKIFLICQQSKRSYAVPAYQFWEDYLKHGIEEAGGVWIEAEGVDWAEGLACADPEASRRWRETAWERTLSEIRRQRPAGIDFVLSYLFPKQVDPAAIEAIQSMGIPCVNFFCDNVREFSEMPAEFRSFALHWVPEFEALGLYEAAGARHLHLPMPAWIPPERRVWDHSENYGVSFIGSRDPLREAFLASVLKKGVDLEIRGAGWSHGSLSSKRPAQEHSSLYERFIREAQFLLREGFSSWFWKVAWSLRRPIPDEVFTNHVHELPSSADYMKILQESLVTVGISRTPHFRRSWNNPILYSRLRDIEAPMLGACYLAENTAGLGRLYDLGTEVETYSTADEMAQKIKWLMADRDRRQSLRKAGQRRALSDYTIPRSLARIASDLGIQS
jgi:hypothetical protein